MFLPLCPGVGYVLDDKPNRYIIYSTDYQIPETTLLLGALSEVDPVRLELGSWNLQLALSTEQRASVAFASSYCS